MAMRGFFSWLALAGLSLTTIACGARDHKGVNRGIIPIVESRESPREYTLADPECQTKSETQTLTKTQIYAWDGDQVVTKDVDLTGTTSGKSLTAPAIRETTWNDQFERFCDLKRGRDHACDDTKNGGELAWYRNDDTSGGLLHICKDNFAYGRETYESVALTSAYYIERANSRYMALGDSPQALPKIYLSVLPEFIDYLDNYQIDGQSKRYKRYITHNLAYFQGGQMIAVFPENVLAGADPKGFFWESEFVLAHEFGHHIDWSRHGIALESLGLKWNPMTHSFIDQVSMAAGQGAVSGRGQVVGSIAEGFADLLAYYSEGATARSLVGLAELGQNRNIGTGKFSNGDDKVLTEDRLEHLLKDDDGDEIEGAPRFSDIHIIGAILSHTMDDVFTSLIDADGTIVAGSEASVRRRYQLTLAWMDALVGELKKAKSDGATGASLTDPIARALEKTVDGYFTRFPLTGDDAPGMDAIRAEVCRKTKEALPAIPIGAFAASTGC